MKETKPSGMPNKPLESSDGFMNRRQFLSVSAAVLGAMASARTIAKTLQPSTTVSIAQADTYDRALVRKKIEGMFNQLGGIRDVVGPGDRVVIKVNLTGGLSRQGKLPYSPIETYFTHPEVVRAVAELAVDSGAKKLYIVDGIFDDISYSETGYTAIAKPLHAELIDLNKSDPYKDFAHLKVNRFQIYEEFIFNRLLEEADAYISIPKMKCHQGCGVTLSLKNNFGLAPVPFYDNPKKPQHIRAALHGEPKESRARLPKVITDINIARPNHLAVIDGILTSEGGEGPWQKLFKPKRANVLIAGKDPVAADAIGTAAMGFDPEAKDFEVPFFNSMNHLAMARAYGLGTNRLNEIRIVGVDLKQVVQSFTPGRRDERMVP